MLGFNRTLPALEDRGPLRVMFLLTSMPVGGAETLLVNLIRRLDRDRFTPSLCCLKDLGPLGEELSVEIPAFHNLTNNKFDVRVAARLARIFREQRIDAVCTVGAGDKMFWGRLAAHFAGVPVVMSAIHSTGWPDGIGRLNRLSLLTRWTDAYIGVAQPHGRHLTEVEKFPASKVRVIANGVDVQRFRPGRDTRVLREKLGIASDAPVAGIVAALRPEKNHELFLRIAAAVHARNPQARFLIVGDGPERAGLEKLCDELQVREAVQFLGTRGDTPELLSVFDVFVLTSRMEANPVSILEAMATGKPVVAPNVGSIGESVAHGQTGFLVEPHVAEPVVERLLQLFSDRELSEQFGKRGREWVVQNASLESMVAGYEDLMAEIYQSKVTETGQLAAEPVETTLEPAS